MTESLAIRPGKTVACPAIHWLDEDSIFSGTQSLLRGISDQAVILHGVQYSRAVADRLCAAYEIPLGERSMAVNSAAEHEVEQLLRSRVIAECSTILAVGGGRIQDVAKRIAHQSGKALVVMPTLIATDGVASPVAVIRDALGRSSSYGAKAPDTVFLCWSLLARVPKIYWQALTGDVIGNLVAVRDFRRFGIHALPSKLLSAVEQGCRMAEAAAMRIMEFSAPGFENDTFRRMLVDSAIDSSFAMVNAGTSQPCSGSEHLLSHAIDHLRLHPGWLHGLQVGAAVPFCLDLHGETALRTEVKRLYACLGIEPSLLHLGTQVVDRIEDILRLAPDMRPERATVLSQFSTAELLRRIKAPYEY